MAGQEVTVTNNAPTIHGERKAELDAAVQGNDWLAILTRCPVRESAALGNISGVLGFRKIEDYEKAVRRLLSRDAAALKFTRDLFGNLCDQLGS